MSARGECWKLNVESGRSSEGSPENEDNQDSFNADRLYTGYDPIAGAQNGVRVHRPSSIYGYDYALVLRLSLCIVFSHRLRFWSPFVVSAPRLRIPFCFAWSYVFGLVLSSPVLSRLRLWSSAVRTFPLLNIRLPGSVRPVLAVLAALSWFVRLSSTGLSGVVRLVLTALVPRGLSPRGSHSIGFFGSVSYSNISCSFWLHGSPRRNEDSQGGGLWLYERETAWAVGLGL